MSSPDPFAEKGRMGQRSTRKEWSDLDNITLTLVLWDIFIAIPLSILLVKIGENLFVTLGYEEMVFGTSGTWCKRLLSVVINVLLVVIWAVKLSEMQRQAVLQKKIEHWDIIIEQLAMELDRVNERKAGYTWREELALSWRKCCLISWSGE